MRTNMYDDPSILLKEAQAEIDAYRAILTDIDYLLEEVDHIDCDSPVHRKIKSLLNKGKGE